MANDLPPTVTFENKIRSADPLDAAELRRLLQVGLHPGNAPKMAVRVGVETIDTLERVNRSIKAFDKASADLIETTSRLTKWILGFTVAAAILGLGSLLATTVMLYRS